MLPTQNVDPITLQRVRDLVRGNFSVRDELYAAAEALDDVSLADICRHLADDLGGNAAALQQLLIVAGQQPAEPTISDKSPRRQQEIATERLNNHDGECTVLAGAEAAEEQLKEVYDSAVDATSNDQVEGLLRSQRKGVAFGETVLRKVKDGAGLSSS